MTGMSAAASYIRVKRYKQTLFLHCDLHLDTVLALKERVESLAGVPVLQQKLLLGKQALDTQASVLLRSIVWRAGFFFSISHNATQALESM